MNLSLDLAFQITLIGVGATIVMDLWALSLKRLFSIPSLNWAMVGRWLGHLPRGQFKHTNIGEASPLAGELIIGWLAHYAIGIIFAFALVLGIGEAWIFRPTPIPAVVFGLITVVFPFFIMQPGMSAGIAASKTPKPNQARFLSMLAHSVFGLGLYISAMLLMLFTRLQ